MDNQLTSMNYLIDIQHASNVNIPISDEQLIHWAQLALTPNFEKAELTLRLVNVDEITHLNHHYRNQNKPTNVLAFPIQIPADIKLDYPLLGDIIICPAILSEESVALKKSLEAHWALIVIHGVLHLSGYDHIDDDDTERMQALEIKCLAELGFDNPYQDDIN